MKTQRSIALVTGASRGLGRALVLALVQAGAAKVYAAARDPGTVSGLGPQVVPIALDVTRPDQVAEVARRAGDVGLLINNAGVALGRPVLEASAADLERELATNVLGTLSVVRAFVPVLERAADATIVNVLSLASLASVPSMAGYSASKAASYSLTQALRASLAPRGIAVLAALPGPIDTDMARGITLPKASPASVAEAILSGAARGDAEIFPDPLAAELGPLWQRGPKELERAFAAM